MAWQTEMPVVLRHMIGDFGEPPTYSDSRLRELILFACQPVQIESDFGITYRADFDAFDIFPDPTSAATNSRDENFLWLVTLKAACILTKAELKISGGQALSIQDEGSRIDLKGVFEGRMETAKQFCLDYENARWKYGLAVRPTGQGIFGPFSIITPSVYGVGGGFQTLAVRDRPLFN